MTVLPEYGTSFVRLPTTTLRYVAPRRKKQLHRAVGDQKGVDIRRGEAGYSSSSWSKCGWWVSNLVGSAGVETPRPREQVVMPLIHPTVHGTPFAVGIEILGRNKDGWPCVDPAGSGFQEALALQKVGKGGSEETLTGKKRRDWSEDVDSDDERMYELRFVLDGKGFLCQADKRGSYEKVDDLQPGDAIACTPGIATVEEGEFSDRIVTMVVYVPKMLVEGIDDKANLGRAMEIASRFVETTWKEEGCLGCVSDILSEEDMLSVLRGSSSVVKNDDDDDDASREEGWQKTHDDTMVDIQGLQRHGESSLQSSDEYDVAIEKDDAFRTVKMRLSDVSTYMLPDQTNRLALMFDPLSQIPFPFVVGVEIFEPGHRTNPHVHSSAYELFFILSGQGEGFCNSERFPVRPGDIVVFHPGSTHGIDNGNDERMYCVEIMLPDQNFAEFVRAGQVKDLHLDDLCILARIGCS